MDTPSTHIWPSSTCGKIMVGSLNTEKSAIFHVICVPKVSMWSWNVRVVVIILVMVSVCLMRTIIKNPHAGKNGVEPLNGGFGKDGSDEANSYDDSEYIVGYSIDIDESLML